MGEWLVNGILIVIGLFLIVFATRINRILAIYMEKVRLKGFFGRDMGYMYIYFTGILLAGIGIYQIVKL